MSRNLFKENNITKEQFAKELQEKLYQDWSLPKLGVHFNCSAQAIHAWIKKLNLINRRQNIRNKEWLYEQYVICKKSAEEIAKQEGVTPEAILWHLEKKGIQKRTRSQVQQIAKHKRPVTYLHKAGSYKSRGYCSYFKNIYCRSTGELLWLIQNYEGNIIKPEPFVINNYRPDFLLNNNCVIEIKQYITDDIILKYLPLGEAIKAKYGYDYKLLGMANLFPKEYFNLIKEIKSKGGKPGHAIIWCN